jgi:4-hydroxy-2-oxovalerate aldolase
MKKMRDQNLQILECTLRDGSYVVDFQFTARDTAIIAAALENAGFNLIEIGHGVGLNSSNAGKGVAAATDEEYMQAAASTLKQAQWGMFFIPGIARHEDLELAASYGMGFVRIGTNATEVEQSKDYIEHAKKLGMFVSANLMKSYVLSPKELATQAKLSEELGSDLICLVDSAGTMLPDDIRRYMTVLQDVLAVPIGLHCHDNLGLGMANVLMAIECGAQRVDSTLQGMGRGGGNPVTEVLVTVLKKQGIDLGIDLNRLMDISDRIIKPLLQDKGWDSIDITSGYAGFHSSYLKTILKYADRYQVDPRDLIVGVCKVDQVYAREELVEATARQLQQQRVGKAGMHIVSLPRVAFPNAKAQETIELSLAAAIRKVAQEVKTEATKRGKHSVFNIVAASQLVGKATVSRFIQEEFGCVIGSAEVDNPEQLKEVLAVVDGIVDVLLVDSELKAYLDQPLTSCGVTAKQSQVFGYKDNDVWVRSVDRKIGEMLRGVHGRHVTVCGTDNLAMKLALSLIEQGAEVTLTGDTHEQLTVCAEALKRIALGYAAVFVEANPAQAAQGADVLVGFARQKTLITRPMLEVLPADSIVFDAGIGSVSADEIAYANKRGLRVVRPDMRAALAAELQMVLGARRIVNELMGRGEVAGVPVVAGGLIGRYGEIVVDSISNPSRVVGVADGHGTVVYGSRPEFAENLAKVENEILRRQVIAD